jgi:hypothetical protein
MRLRRERCFEDLRHDRRGQTVSEWVIVASVVVTAALAGGAPLVAALRHGFDTTSGMVAGASGASNSGGPAAPTVAHPSSGQTTSAVTGASGSSLESLVLKLGLAKPKEPVPSTPVEALAEKTRQLQEHIGFNSPEAVDAQNRALMAAWPDLLQTARSGSTQERVEALQIMSSALNTPSFRGTVGNGNCLFASMALMESMKTGAPIVPKSYDGRNYSVVWENLTGKDNAANTWSGNDHRAAEAQALERLGEGEMALLIVRGTRGTGHAVAITKIDGQLFVIDNQTSPGSPTSLADYDAEWRSRKGDLAYRVVFNPDADRNTTPPPAPPKRWYEVWR